MDIEVVFLSQLYGIPEYLVMNGIRIPFISFDQAATLLSTEQIIRWILNPLFQPYAGSPSSPNRIITLHNKNGHMYVVKARYQNGTIYPPTNDK